MKKALKAIMARHPFYFNIDIQKKIKIFLHVFLELMLWIKKMTHQKMKKLGNRRITFTQIARRI